MYYFALLMDFHFVPPTVIKNKNLVQLFIDNQEKEKKILLNNLKPIEKSDIYIYYFLFGYVDPSLGNILVGKECNRPALIDNDWFSLSHIQYGDFPFQYYKMPRKDYPNLNVKDYKAFPFDKVQFLKNNEKKKELFQELRFDHKNIFQRHADNLLDETLYFVKWKNAYWLKMNFSFYNTIWKEFQPTVFSKKTLRNLKKIGRYNLNFILSLTDEGDNYKMNEKLKKSYISSILYRRDILLNEAKKLSKKKEKKNGFLKSIKK